MVPRLCKEVVPARIHGGPLPSPSAVAVPPFLVGGLLQGCVRPLDGGSRARGATARAGRRRRLRPPPPLRILHERRRRGARVSNPVSSSPSSSPSPSSSLHLPHSSLFLSPDPATTTSSSTDPAAATSSPTDLAAAPSSFVDLAVERPDPTVDLHHGHDAGTSTTAGEDALAWQPPSTTARRDPRGGGGVVPCERLARWLRPWEARIYRRWARQWARERARRRAPGFFCFFKMINRSGHPNVPAVVKVYLPRRARPPAAVKPRFTVASRPRRTALPVAKNRKCPPLVKFV